ncbi:MAG: pyridoxal-phosphate dependent enzyme [Phycisphaerales bacterium]|nr:pyridoxal-phosphate dependent enzyme [Phycisphaerales bacterium]
MTNATTGGVFQSVLELIGNTPMLRISRIETGRCELFVKLECQNPGQSIKDRIALKMVEVAEAEGRLRAGGRIIEATAGNTGIALALVAAVKGYRLTVVMPDKMSEEKMAHLRAMGAEVVLTRSDVAKGHPEYYQDIAQRMADEDPSSFYVNQFDNANNPLAHYETTAPEIWEQMDGRIDAFVAGVGSGGTIAGVARFLKERNSKCEIVLADPRGSILAPLVNEGKRVEAGSWLVEGIGEDFVPSILDLAAIDCAYSVTDAEAFAAVRELLCKEGILAGSSVGVLLHAALAYCRAQTSPRRVVTLICDSGAKYLSKMYNDFWMRDQGFIERARTGDLRDLIARRHDDREDFVLHPTMPLAIAVRRMRMFSVSQMAVLDEADHLVGILDESDVLLALAQDPQAQSQPVSAFMVSRVETIHPSKTPNDLLPIFRADKVAVVHDGTKFCGLITKIDLINHLRAHAAS